MKCSFFIDNANTYLGTNLYEKFSQNSDNVIYGTLHPQNSNPPNPNLQIVVKDELGKWKSQVLQCDVIIFDLMTSDLTEVEYFIKTIKFSNLEKDITMIAISSVLFWGKTPAKKVEKGTEEEEGEEEEEIVEESAEDQLQEGEEDQEGKAPKKKFKRVGFSEEDYTCRKSPLKYEPQKSIETLLISASLGKKNFFGYVIAAGLLYGKGENTFNYHFKSAWLEDPEALPYIGEGTNIIPTIHVKDLSTLLQTVIDNKPDIKYIFGVDESGRQTQKQIIQAISLGIGTGKIQSIPNGEEYDWNEDLTIDLWLLPSQLVKPKEVEEEVDEDVEVKVKEFQWHCRKGITQNISILEAEFNQNRNLKPIKIFISGPPAAGKTYYGKKLSEQYNIPLIQVKEIIEWMNVQEGDFKDRLQEAIDALREKKAEELEAKGIDKDEIDTNAIEVRHPDDLIAQGFQIRLSKNHCRNRGYVLDGWPKSHTAATYLFFHKVSKTGEEGGEDEVDELFKEIFPQSIISLDDTDNFLLQRVKDLPQEAVNNSHYDEENMNRRLSEWRKLNEGQSGNPTLMDFFEENGSEVYKVNSSQEEYSALQSMLVYVERNGKPFNYLSGEQELEKLRQEESEKLQAEMLHKQKLLEAAQENQEQEDRNKLIQQTESKLQQIYARERELLENKAQPLKQYLHENLVPILADGLFYISKTQPQDPIDELVSFHIQSKYLFKNAYKVPCADPGKYFGTI